MLIVVFKKIPSWGDTKETDTMDTLYMVWMAPAIAKRDSKWAPI